MTDTSLDSIILDAGHGLGSPKGWGNYREWVGNRKFARSLEIYLAGHNAVDMINSCPVDISLKDRVEFANMFPKSIYISIHSNGSANHDARGHVVFYYEGSRKSKMLAQCISDELTRMSGIPSRGIKATRRLFVLNKTKSPAVLVERFFHDNDEDLELGNSPREIDTQACAVSQGILNYKRLVGDL